MRRVLLALALFCWSVSAWAAPAYVAGSHNANTFGESASAETLAYGGNLTAGSLLVAVVVSYDTGVTVSVSDGTNGSYTQAGTYSAFSTTSYVSIWYKANNTATGTPTVTVTPSGLSYLSISLDEFTGIATTSPVRNTGNASATSATQTTATVTATAGDLVVAALNEEDDVSVNTMTAPFTLVTDLATDEGIHTAYHLSAAGNEAATFNMAGSVHGSTIIASFIPATVSTSQGRSLLGVGK